MAKPSDPGDDWLSRRDSIIGLGERSFHKSYYPQLRQNLDRLERFRTLLDQTADFVMLLALPEGVVVDANAALGRLLGESTNTLVGRPLTAFGIDGAEAMLEQLRRHMSGLEEMARMPTSSMVVEFGPPDAHRWLELSLSLAVLDGRCFGVLVGRDVTERHRNEEMVSALLAEKEVLLDNALVGIVMVKHRRIVSCNRRFEEIFGYGAGGLDGAPMKILYPSEEAFEMAGEIAFCALGNNHPSGGTLSMVRADGSRFWAEVAGRSIDPAQPMEGSIWVFSDISERRMAEERAEFLAYHDVLTGLPNRSLVKDRLQRSMAVAERSGARIAFLVIDLDHFKTINDSLGYSVGDSLLVEVARRLAECLSEDDTIARQGGDEFLILLPDLHDVEASAALLARLTESVAEPLHIDGKELATTVSVGVAVFPDDGADLETLQKKADMAMYRAKEAGGNTYRFYNEGMNEEAAERLAMHLGLRRALGAGQFVLHYQPQVEISGNRLIGIEALLRWQHPDRGLVPPGHFIPLAEESGLIVPIGEWVLNEACRAAMRWQQAGIHDVAVAVNLSAVQFKRGDIEGSVALALKESGLDPALLELELTESILIQDTEQVLATVKRLKLMGVKLSIDDFGTGYSSLAYLKRFNVDKLKIDQSFIRNLASDPEDAAIVRAIVQMARSLGLRTIAEGVEDRHILDRLRLYHCDEAQGYFLSRPIQETDFISAWGSQATLLRS